jgi:hypothetical protein
MERSDGPERRPRSHVSEVTSRLYAHEGFLLPSGLEPQQQILEKLRTGHAPSGDSRVPGRWLCTQAGYRLPVQSTSGILRVWNSSGQVVKDRVIFRALWGRLADTLKVFS